jgi:hypothetical protein
MGTKYLLTNENVDWDHLAACTIILAMSGLFLVPALDNGFPFVFSDTGTYLSAVLYRHIPEDRPIYYSIFTTLFDWRLSPWLSIAVQSLITAWIIWYFVSDFFSLTAASQVLSMALLLTLATSLPWFVGQLMPDIFTSLMILALTLLCFSRDTLTKLSRIILMMLVSAAVAVHQANLLLTVWMLPAFVLCALLGWRPSRRFLHGLVASGIALTLGAAGLVAANLVGGHFALSSNGSVFFMARLLEDGTALSYLEQACPQQRFAVCAHLDELKSYRPTINSFPGNRSDEVSLYNYFLFYGPLQKLGGFRGEQAEAGAIVANTLAMYPLAQSCAAVGNGWRQLFRFRTGDGLYAYPETEPVSSVIQKFGTSVYDHYRQSKQIRGIFGFDWFDSLNRIHIAVVLVSFAILIIGFLRRGFRKQTRASYAAIFVIILVAGNAFTLGALSGPYDRYQSRVIWLVPLLASCFVLGRDCRTPPVKTGECPLADQL